MRRKISAMLIIIILLITLSNCSVNSPGNKTGTANSTVETSAQKNNNFNAEGLPIVDETITIRVLVWINRLTDDLHTIKTFNEMEKKTNICIEWGYVRTDWEEKKTIMLANNDLPDAFFGASLTPADIISHLECLYPLENYIDKYCPNIKKMHLEEPDTLKRATTPDGHIYTLSSVMPWRPKTIDCSFINKTWLDNLNLKMPETTDEFYKTMIAFKTQDPNRNGQFDEIPVGTVGIWELSFIFSAFGVVDNVWGWLHIDDGNVKYCRELPEYKEAIQYIHKLYNEGLIDQEMFTQDTAQFISKIQKEDELIIGVSSNWTINTGVGNENTPHYTQLMPLKGPDGQQHWREWLESRIWTGSFIMTRKNPYPEETMRWIDQWYDEEMSAQLYFGPLDVGLKLLSDGRYQIIDPPDPATTYDSWLWKNGMGSGGPMYVGREFEKLIIPNSWITERINLDTPLIPFLDEMYPVIIFWDKKVSDRLSIIETSIEEFADSKMTQWIVDGGIEDEWDSYIAELNNMGLSDMMEIYQTGYNDYHKQETGQ